MSQYVAVCRTALGHFEHSAIRSRRLEALARSNVPAQSRTVRLSSAQTVVLAPLFLDILALVGMPVRSSLTAEQLGADYLPRVYMLPGRTCDTHRFVALAAF